MCQERSRKQFSSLCRCCEARASLFKSQKRSGKQFSPLLRSCEARASLFQCGKETSHKAVLTAEKVM